MAVSLTHIGEILRPGMWQQAHADDSLTEFSLGPHLKRLQQAGVVSCIGDLSSLPDRLEAEGVVYGQRLVPAGRQYPQGYGRLRPGEDSTGADGKVAVWKLELDTNRAALLAEISELIERESQR